MPTVLVLLAAILGLSGCTASESSPVPSSKWTTGFWFWDQWHNQAGWSTDPIDVLFVKAGKIRIPIGREQSFAFGRLPDNPPPAREYWLVFRYDKQGVPPIEAATALSHEVTQLLTGARKNHINVAGVQLDIDSPTGQLSIYGAFLHEVRKGLPKNCPISITALLDWFRSGTSVSDVIQEADEFVPQFYDTDHRSYREGVAIAAPIDAARWGPVFNRFHKRFRLGVSTFGRVRIVKPALPGSSRRLAIFGDLVPLDLATNPAFRLEAAHNPAGELVLTYRATRWVRIGYTGFDPGDAVQFILATPESIRNAIAAAHQIHGYMAGVLFFRWPTSEEVLAMQPDEVLQAAGVPLKAARESRIDIVNGHCSAVECVDVYLESARPLSPRATRYRIHSCRGLEYFLPEKSIPVRMTGPSELDCSLPAYCSRGHLYLGRAVSEKRAEFTVEEEQ